jgi:predicted secreted protein
MNIFLGIAIFVILWWLVLFTLLPMGAQSAHEAGEQYAPGAEHGAPKVHNLRRKMAIATGIAAVLWLGVAWAISVDFFHVYGP